MTDFKTQYDNLKKIINSINRDITKYQQKRANNQSPGTLISEIKGGFKKIDRELEIFEQTISDQVQNPENYQINYREAERRQNLLNELKNMKEQSKKNYEGADQQSIQMHKTINFQTKNQFQDQHDTEQMSNQQIHMAAKSEEQKQEEKLDQLIDTVGTIKHVGKQIGQELDEQEVLIDELDQGMDKNTRKIEKTTNKMDKLLMESSTCCLGITIFVELALLVVILIWV